MTSDALNDIIALSFNTKQLEDTYNNPVPHIGNYFVITLLLRYTNNVNPMILKLNENTL